MRTPEYRAKMSAAKKGPWTEEHLANHAAAMRRPDVIAKTSSANRGLKRSAETRLRLSEAAKKRGNKTPEAQAYAIMHKRLIRELGQPRECEYCGSVTAKKFEWAFTGSGHGDGILAYSENLEDYIRLCTSCHRKFDRYELEVMP